MLLGPWHWITRASSDGRLTKCDTREQSSFSNQGPLPILDWDEPHATATIASEVSWGVRVLRVPNGQVQEIITSLFKPTANGCEPHCARLAPAHDRNFEEECNGVASDFLPRRLADLSQLRFKVIHGNRSARASSTSRIASKPPRSLDRGLDSLLLQQPLHFRLLPRPQLPDVADVLPLELQL